MRTIILLIPITFGFLAFINLFFQDFFGFFMWSFVAAALFLAILPITFNTKKQAVPVYQIFATILIFFIAISVMSYFEITRLKLPAVQAVIYSGVMGILITSLVVAIRPK